MCDLDFEGRGRKWAKKRPSLCLMSQFSKPVGLKFEHALESLGGLVNHRFLSSNPRMSDLVALGWGLRTRPSGTFPDGNAIAGLGLHLEDQ